MIDPIEIYSAEQVNEALDSIPDSPLAKAVLDSRKAQSYFTPTPKKLTVAIARIMVQQGVVRL